MAKMTLGAISNPGFTGTMQLLLTKPLPIKAAWKIKTLVGKFNEELKKFGDLRKEILERHCKKTEAGEPEVDDKQNYQFEDGKLELVTKEMNELASIEVEFTPIKLDELGDVELTAQNLFDLGDLLDA